MGRSAIIDVLVLVNKGKVTVKEGTKMIELIEKESKSFNRTKNHTINLHEKTNTYVSPIYTRAYLVEYFSVPKNV